MVSAHPDDIEACVGGLVYTLTSQGTQVYYAILTNGDKGCGSPICANWTSEHIAYQRSLEAINAAAVLGVPEGNVFLLDYEDAMLTSYPEQQPREDLVKIMRTVKPQVVMTWYPYPNFKLQPSQGWDDLGFHPDHQQSGRLTLAAQFDSGVPLLFPMTGAGWPIEQFYMWAFSNPDLYYSMTNATLQKKIQAYEQHKTQYPTTQSVVQAITLVAERVASETDANGVEYAEAFIRYW